GWRYSRASERTSRRLARRPNASAALASSRAATARTKSDAARRRRGTRREDVLNPQRRGRLISFSPDRAGVGILLQPFTDGGMKRFQLAGSLRRLRGCAG